MPWVVATSTRVCVLAEVPPDQCRQAMVASRRNGGDAMEVMFEPVAALDVGKETVTVCLRNDEARTRRLIAQLERLGHTVITNPAA